MRIGIIGAGNIGGSLTRRLTTLGHEVYVANSRAPETLTDLATASGATPVWAREAARDADVVILSIPQRNVPDLEPGIFARRKDGAPIIETNNYYPQQRDGLIAAIEDGQTESGWVPEQIGQPVVKVFNGIFWKFLLERGESAGEEDRIALPIAGDDAAAKVVVSNLLDELGFDTVDGGTIAESWRQQPGTPVYGQHGTAEESRTALEQASPERTADWKAA